MYEELIARLRGYARAYRNDNPYDIPAEALKAAEIIKKLQSELDRIKAELGEAKRKE